MFRADLHCHTTFSDGSLTPGELISLAKEIGLSGLSITDHDTIAAYETAIPAAKEMGILLGAGVEFSCEHEGETVHILGYDFLLSSPALKELCKRHEVRRNERNRAILENLKKNKMPIEESELQGHIIGRPHIATLMVKKGYVKSLQEAFQLYLAEGKKCYARGTPFSVQETLDIIHSASGKALIAHPHLIARKRFLKVLLNMPFDGIECYYARCSPEQDSEFLSIAKEKQWLISGGSDFHGTIKPNNPLGSSWVDESAFKALFSTSTR